MNINNTLGAIVSKYPNTVHVMNQYKLDYCCGGNDTLDKALKAIPEDYNIVLEKLTIAMKAQAKEEVKDWSKKSLSEIIDHILETHHVFMRDAIEDLNVMLFKLLKVHYRSHGESLLKIHKLFGTLKTELEAHLVKEEENLFPLIKSYEFSKSKETLDAIYQFVQDTEDEHDAAGDLFKSLEIETNNYTLPENVCTTYRKAYALLDALEKDTFNHIHMENSVLFKLLEKE